MALSWGVIVSYGSPSFALAGVLIMLTTYLPSFYADVVGVPLAQIGLVTTVAQVCAAFMDPLVGLLSDRHRTQFGRRRPWLLGGTLLLAVNFVALFTPPRRHTVGTFIYVTAFILLVVFAMSIVRVPWMAWGVELTPEHDEKTKVAGSRELLFVTGCLVAAALPALFGAVLDDISSRLLVCSAVWGFLLCLLGAWCFFAVPDTSLRETGLPPLPSPGAVAVPPPQLAWPSGDSRASVCAFLRRMRSNRCAVVLYITSVLFSMAVTMNILMLPFFIKYVLERERMQELLVGLSILVAAFGVPVWVRLSMLVEKKLAFCAAMGLQAVTITVAFFAVDTGYIGGYAVLVILAGTAFAGVPTLKYSVIADVADLDQLLAKGVRDEGQIISLFEMSSKLASSGTTALAFWSVDQSGYQAGVVPQSEPTKNIIRIFYALVPGIMGLTAVVIMLAFYPLSRAGHAALVAQMRSVGAQAGVSAKVVPVTGSESALAPVPLAPTPTPPPSACPSSCATPEPPSFVPVELTGMPAPESPPGCNPTPELLPRFEEDGHDPAADPAQQAPFAGPARPEGRFGELGSPAFAFV